MIILATTLLILFLFFVFDQEERKMFYDDLLREAEVFVMTSKRRTKMKVTPIAPVILIPKKTDKVENDPQPRKIKKREKK